MSSVELPRLDTAAVKRLAREHAPTYKLYNPAPEWFSEQYCGVWFYFPPDLGGILVNHPVQKDPEGKPLQVKADGILHVKDRYGKIYGKKATIVTHPEFGYTMGWALPVIDPEGKLEEESADKIVQFFVKKFGPEAESPVMALGITLLSGDPEVDETIKRESKKMWVAAHRAWAEQERATRMQEIAKWKEINPGRTDLPPMSARARRAEEILLAAEEDRNITTLRFVCECGGYETDDEIKFNKHVQIRHPQRRTAEANTTNEDTTLPKRPRGRPRKNPLPEEE